MTIQKITIGLVAVALFVGSMTAHAAEFDAGAKAYNRGDYATALRIFRQLAEQGDAKAQIKLGFMYDTGLGVRSGEMVPQGCQSRSSSCPEQSRCHVL